MRLTAKALKRVARRVFLAYSKKELLEFLKDKLRTDDRWAGRALERIYQGQTSDEQIEKTTKVLNNRGFSGAHAEFLTSVYEWYISHNRTLTPKQWASVHKIMPRYAEQLYRSGYFRQDTLIEQYELSRKQRTFKGF